MPQDNIQAAATDLVSVFSRESLLFVPIFQRPYVWTKPTIDALFENIDEIDLAQPDDTHFVGAVFTSERRRGEAGRAEEFWLIDGQQRLTTVYLALLQLAMATEKALPSGAPERQEFLRKLERYLFEHLATNAFQPRMMPTLRDCRQFRDALSQYKSASYEVQLPPAEGPDDGYMARAFAHIGKRVGQLVSEARSFSLKKAEGLFKKLLNRLIVVRISLSESDDPTQIFHTLNATGQKLEIVDLVRNDIFKRIKDDNEYTKCRDLYDKQWKVLEQRFESSEALNKYMFPYALTTKPTAKASKLYPSLRDMWRGLDAEPIIADLKKHAGVYLAFGGSTSEELESLSLPTAIKEQFYRLRRMGSGLPSSTFPFLFNLHNAWREQGITEDTFLRNLRLIESFLVRRFCLGYEPTGLHAVFKGLWKETKGDPGLFLEVFASNRTVSFPDDDEFREHLIEKPVAGRSLAPYLAMEYERFCAPNAHLPPGENPADGVVLEHLMPESPAPGWELPPPESTFLTNTWGNLVPRAVDEAAPVGDIPWAEARALRQSSQFASVRETAASDAWNATSIRARGEKLASWAVGRWPKQLPKK